MRQWLIRVLCRLVDLLNNRCLSVTKDSKNRGIRCELEKGHKGNHRNTKVSTDCEFQW